MKPKTHYRDIRLFCNAGMYFPACYSVNRPLDTDKGRLPTSGIPKLVTCKHCLAIMRRENWI